MWHPPPCLSCFRASLWSLEKDQLGHTEEYAVRCTPATPGEPPFAYRTFKGPLALKGLCLSTSSCAFMSLHPLVNLLCWCPGFSCPALLPPPLEGASHGLPCLGMRTSWKHAPRAVQGCLFLFHFSSVLFIPSTFRWHQLCARFSSVVWALRAEKGRCWEPCVWVTCHLRFSLVLWPS